MEWKLTLAENSYFIDPAQLRPVVNVWAMVAWRRLSDWPRSDQAADGFIAACRSIWPEPDTRETMELDELRWISMVNEAREQPTTGTRLGRFLELLRGAMGSG